ncbi:MAG: DUF4127 family protein [Selenomonadaceae bacterium]|nr:DUF4127 family protein [Selenomonadaceae bacterium]MBR3721497.1 DUF4127 family protein [Selenomonadaceae bacterium]
MYRLILAFVLAFVVSGNLCLGQKLEVEKAIIYIPHDDRPISMEQTADVVKRAGYRIIMPPREFLGNRNSLGNPEMLWKWYEAVMKKASKDKTKDIVASVVSSDAMLYGSLVASRKHSFTEKELLFRVKKFKELKKKYPDTFLYVFSSIMRTPKNGAASGHMEPEYYASYGEDIFRYTALIDKKESDGLNDRNKRELEFLTSIIPRKALYDWQVRRNKNLNVNKALMDLARSSTFDYLLLGRDDNAPYSATHQEKRKLISYGVNISKDTERTAAGIDEAGMLLLTRAVLKDRNLSPNVFVRYNWGSGEFVIPSYSDEAIDYSVNDAIEITGANRVDNIKEANLVLAVNTNPNGKTGDAALYSNDGAAREGTGYFAETIEEYIDMKKPVVVADIALANGADNALMEALKKRGLLFKLTGYAGWNTATNSTGFAVAAGLLAKDMTTSDKNALLKTRYLDDWMYQGNVRNIVARQLTWLKGDGVYGALNDKKGWAEERVANIMESFLREDLPMVNIKDVDITLPWNRMFEANIRTK